MNTDVLVARFQQWGRWRHQAGDFHYEGITADEYTYKLERGQQMREWFGKEGLRELIGRQEWGELRRRLHRSFQMQGALANRYEYQWVLDLNDEETQELAVALEQFLHGQDPFLERLDQFVEKATAIYLGLRDRDPVYKKRYGAKKLAWPFVSYFHFVMWPDQGYVFVKPQEIQEAARLAGFDLKYQGAPNPTTYARVQEFYRALWPSVQRLHGRNMIDVQTLIRVAGNGFGPPEGGWIDELSTRAAATLPPAVSKVSALLRTKPQVVLQGAPGTGKTHTALLAAANVLGLVNSDAESTRQALRHHQLTHYLEDTPTLMDDPHRLADRVRVAGHGLWEIVQLHPSYTYEDFVRGLQAVPSGERVTFRAVNRTLGLLAETSAELAGDHLPVVLILDEINRGDLSKVLGELIYTLEYRDEGVLTPYAVDGRLDLTLPDNLYFIGTMNTADRSIALVDYAIRRRFYFVTLRADRDAIVGYYHGRLALGQQAVILFDAVSKLFDELQAGYDRHDLMVGHTYFLAQDAESLALKFAYDAVPLLREYQREGLLENLT